MKYLYIWALISVLCLSCTEFDEEINKNPNQPSEASASQLIANSALYLSGLASSTQAQFNAQYLAETQYIGLSLYSQGAFSFYGYYQGPLMNLEKVIQNPDEIDGNDGPVANQLAVAKILKAYYMWYITDRWGDVPYSEALQGIDDYTPAYDSQESIYNDLFVLLKEANDQIVSGSIDNDFIFDGDMTKWKKLANSIRLLMALRLSEVDPAKGEAEFNAALTDGIMGSNDDNLVYRHLAEESQENYWYGQIVKSGREWWALSEGLVDKMLPVEDPRLYVYGQPNSDGNYIGLEYGRTNGWTDISEELKDLQYPVSMLGTQIYAQDAPVFLITYPQLLFAQAEAAKLGWLPGGDAEAQGYYEMAIKESLIMWTGSDEGFDAMNAYPEVAYNPANAIEQIATQRYVHLFMNGYEAWAEYRRTGYPEMVTAGGREVPTRQGYPDEEKFLNEANYNEAVKRIGGDTPYDRVWWDAN